MLNRGLDNRDTFAIYSLLETEEHYLYTCDSASAAKSLIAPCLRHAEKILASLETEDRNARKVVRFTAQAPVRM